MYSDYYIHDIENYCNFFSCRITRDSDGAKWCFEISPWKNEGFDLFIMINQIAASNGVMVGYNNLKYDYPVLHLLMEYGGNTNNAVLFRKGSDIIRDGNMGNAFAHTIWDNQMYCPQLDLMAIHHFDNKAKSTSLKLLEFNMRMDDIQELPYDPKIALTRLQADHLLHYNDHDVDATRLFYNYSKKAIDFRIELSEKYGKSFMNHNDTRIGQDIVCDILKGMGVDVGKHNQTFRSEIHVDDIIFDYIKFETPAFNEILDYLRGVVLDPDKLSQTLLANPVTYEMAMNADPKTVWVECLDCTPCWLSEFEKRNPDSDYDALSMWGDFSIKYVKDKNTSLNVVVNGFKYDIGAGGIHGSIKNTIKRTGNGKRVLDIDVEGFYVAVSIVNRVYPAHLGDGWCDAMTFLKTERKAVGKKSALGGAYKLGGNGSYGKSKDKHSPFYDPQYTMQITFNGQLMLMMLTEWLGAVVPSFEMIQANTDGITIMVDDEDYDITKSTCKRWEDYTELVLEYVDYRMMAIRDVNNYLAVTMPYTDNDGKLQPSKVKRIGAYAYVRAAEDDASRELPWHKNHSAIVVAKAAEAALVRNVNIESFIRNHVTVDPFDFFLRAKINRGATLQLETDVKWGDMVVTTISEQVPRITRFYMSNDGGRLIKEMVPTENKLRDWLTKPHWRHTVSGVTKQGKNAPSKMWVQCEPPTNKPPLSRGVLQGTKGYLVQPCNTLNDDIKKLSGLDINYYINETRKLVDSLLM
jgi:hypothetical protein